MRKMRTTTLIPLLVIIGISSLILPSFATAYSIGDGSISHSTPTISQLPGYPATVFMHASDWNPNAVFTGGAAEIGFKQDYSIWGALIKEGALYQFSASNLASVNMLVITFILACSFNPGKLYSCFHSTGDVFYFNAGRYTAEVIIEISGSNPVTAKLTGTNLQGRNKYYSIQNFAVSNCLTRLYSDGVASYLEVSVPFSSPTQQATISIKPIAHSAAYQYGGFLECSLFMQKIDIIGTSGY